MEVELTKTLAEQGYYTIVALCINFVISFGFYRLVDNLSKNPKFRDYIKGGIEDGDGVLHFKDMIGSMMMFFGIMFFWLALDIILGSLIFDSDKLTIISAVFMMGGSLFGVGKFVKK